jgi:hypothetical protein
MTDPANAPSSSDAPPPPPSEPPKRRRWWHRWRLILTIVVVAPVLVLALYTLLTLAWSYSEGERAGTLQKFSRKGWVCKTWEGELMQPTAPGVAPTIWYFTVRHEDVARQVSLGLGRQVVIYYKEHPGVPTSCFGDTRYFVDSLRIVR